MRIAAVNGDEAIIGVTVPTTFTQAGAGFFKIKWKLNKVRYTFSKCSANVSISPTATPSTRRGRRVRHLPLLRQRARVAYRHRRIWQCRAGPRAQPGLLRRRDQGARGLHAPRGPYHLQDRNSAGTEQLKDDPGAVRLTINKKDSATLGDAQNGSTLEGAEYKITSLSTPGWEQTGKPIAKGVLTIHDVPLGKIRVEEIKAPNGYKLDSTAHEYEVKSRFLYRDSV